MSTSRKVLLVGWDAADWRVINPLLTAGKMPHLMRLIAGGVSGNMATLYPALSPMLWTSVSTGKRAHKHGIHGFSEPDPDLGGVRPITNLSRKTKAIWNILSQNDKKCIVIGWWPSHPAEPLPKGVMVSNSYQRALNADTKVPWPITLGTVHPASLAETLAHRRIRPTELDKSLILRFVPKADEINQKHDHRLNTLAKIITDCTNIHSAATHLIHNEPWDLMVVYYDAIDHFGHGFMRYHPPRQKWIPKKDFEHYSNVIEAGYCYHDMMLGELLMAVGSDTTVLLMSDHGFHPDKLRPAAIPLEPAGPAVEHRSYGICVLKGPNIKIGERIHGATLLDVCPTVLSLFDLPSGQDMDGKPLLSAWIEPPKIKTIPSWDTVLGPDGVHPPGTRLSPDASREALKQLEALGYIEPLPENAEQAVAKTRRELRYNLACTYIDAQMLGEATEIFAALWSENPDGHRHGTKLFACQVSLGRYVEARLTLQQLKINTRKYAAEAAEELKRRCDEWKDRKPEEFNLKERRGLDILAARSKPNSAPLRQMEAMLLLAENKAESALKILKKLNKVNHSDPDLCVLLAQAHASLKEWNEAELLYKQALELDSDNAHAHFRLAQTYLAKHQNYEAADSALTAIDLLYYNPSAHFLLGVALHRLGQIENAVEALRVCVTQNANFLLAHRRLAHIYENRLNDTVKAAEHRVKFSSGRAHLRRQRLAVSITHTSDGDISSIGREPAKTAFNPQKSHVNLGELSAARLDASFITIVSGLPRSGTSLMMQMLAAGGLPPLYDNNRSADEHNPRGYFEFAPAKNIRMDNSWMRNAEGRTLKLIAQLLPFIPKNHEYRIVFMERSINEVLISQKVMLERQDREGAALSSEMLQATYEQQLAHVKEVLEKRSLPVLYVSHQEAISSPVSIAERVTDFLGLPLNIEAMTNSIDPLLHRQRYSDSYAPSPKVSF